MAGATTCMIFEYKRSQKAYMEQTLNFLARAADSVMTNGNLLFSILAVHHSNEKV